MKANQRIAVIRLKGDPGLKVDVRKTCTYLNLYKKNHCTIIPNTPEFVGMLNVIQEVATWGELDKETCKELLQKRGRLPGNKLLTEQYIKEKNALTLDQFVEAFLSFKKEITDVPGLKKFFKLTPPRHGFESKGVKTQYSLGGALGYRKDKINELLRRMI